MQIPIEVRSAWKHYFGQSNCQPIAGGLSNSRVWRIQPMSGEAYCLKAWPDSSTNEKRLSELQQFVAVLNQQLSFIPQIVQPQAVPSASFVYQSGYYWELTTWLAGKPLSTNEAELTHGQSAVQAVAQLHQTSRSWTSTVGCSPSVAMRIDMLNGYRNNLPVLRSLATSSSSANATLMQQTLGHFDRWALFLIETLDRLMTCPVELLWVVRDLHREHMLFQDTKVTGVIDFGAARVDEPLIDLVRLLGSLWPLRQDVRHQLVEHYGYLREQKISLPRYQVLDHSSTLLSAMQWLQWLVVERRSFALDQQQLLQRWRMLNERLECNQW